MENMHIQYSIGLVVCGGGGGLEDNKTIDPYRRGCFEGGV